MDLKKFRSAGREVIEFIANYHDYLSLLPVTPIVDPGYMRKLVPEDPPNKGEDWDRIMQDLQSVILPGMTHWLHPNFYGYFPSGFSYESLLGDFLSEGAPSIGFSWISSPALTELEAIILDWLGDMIGLPEDFLTFPKDSQGGAALQNSCSDANFLCILIARTDKVLKISEEKSEPVSAKLATNLVVYCSKESRAFVERVARLALVQLRILDTNDKYQLTGELLERAIKDDLKEDLTPFFVVATLGTYSCTSCDALSELGPVCKKYDVWLHVDAAYAGNALVLKEYRHLLEGIEYASSFSMDPAMWLPNITEGTAMWIRDKQKMSQCFVVDPLYLHHQHDENKSAIDYRHWSIHLSRRFRALKYWFVMRLFGKVELRNFIRNHIDLAKYFETLLKNDSRFEVLNKVEFGLVCFRFKGSDILNITLLRQINSTKKLFLTNVTLGNHYVIRFCVCYPKATKKEIDHAFDIIRETADEVLDLVFNHFNQIVT
ncbi:tyrosine decarboxylase-like [Parasteatoda tepidariorum]|uniref:tyrosine decarboxylase-like n=1 Tax=Parasteatoda tepidariorum TaxID=114398 RepID=UPI001C721C58|nr:tyrosine decarboxylase-like [Parasteatoda tepidariorum]